MKSARAWFSLWAALALAGPAAALEPVAHVPTRQEVIERLEAARTRIRQLSELARAATEEERPGGAELRAELISLQHLEALYLTGGHAVDLPVEWSWLPVFLAQSQLDRERRGQASRLAVRQISIMLELLAMQEVAAPAQLARMERILARDEFAGAQTQESAYSAFARRARERLHRLLSRFQLEADNPVLRMTYQFVFILILVGIAAVVGWLIYTRWPRGGSLAPAGPPPSPAEPLPDAGQLARQAEAAERQGRLREALHFAYLAFAAELRQRQLLPLAAARTNWEILHQLSREFQACPALAPLQSANRVYDRAWYGDEACADAELRAALSDLSRARRELPQ